ncbi:MAG: SRPBCC family protein [Burkholderiales bacterium]
MFGVLVMGAGAAYGVFAYAFFTKIFSLPAQGRSGLMQLSFLVLIPLCVTLITGYLLQRHKKISFAQALLLSPAPVLLFVFIAGAFLREGFICILMALPLFLFVAGVGALLSVLFSASSKKKSNKTLCVALLLPFMLGAIEQDRELQDSFYEVKHSIHIKAPPDVIWRHINFPTGIQPAELQGGFAYLIGVPYPVEARTLEPRVGGRRQLVWQRGVSFQEEITAWQENRFIAWKYLFDADSFPAGSLDDHILIGGPYFNLEDTSYTLVPDGDGTRLELAVKFRLSTNFNGYAGLWAKFLISDTAKTILNFYKHRAEAV